jgi:hypothetical protein
VDNAEKLAFLREGRSIKEKEEKLVDSESG